MKTQIVIEARLNRLADYGHWGFVNRFDGLVELKWPTGIQVYTAEIRKVKVLVLLGGNKNAQSKDIKKAKAILKKCADLL